MYPGKTEVHPKCIQKGHAFSEKKDDEIAIP